jgi:hypothetical protein
VGAGGRLWSETVNDIWGFPNHLHEIRNIFLSVCNFPREMLPDVLNDQKFLPQRGFFRLCSLYFDNGIQVVWLVCILESKAYLRECNVEKVLGEGCTAAILHGFTSINLTL